MIEYITDVRKDGGVSYILRVNKKNVAVLFTPEKKSAYCDRMDQATFVYGCVTVNSDLTISTSKAHFAEILLAIELVKVIKEEIN